MAVVKILLSGDVNVHIEGVVIHICRRLLRDVESIIGIVNVLIRIS